MALGLTFDDKSPFTLRKGAKIKKGDLKGQLFRIRFHGKNGTRFFSLLQQAGVIEVRGKVVIVKKDYSFE